MPPRQGLGAGKAEGALAECAARHDFGFQAALEADALADAQLAAGADQRLPIAAIRADRAHQHHLHPAAEILVALGVVFADGQRAHAGAMAEEARGKHAGIVEDQAIAGAEIGGEVAEGAVFPAAGGAVYHQHAGGGAVGKGSCAINSGGRW